jgi:hypothetical protein
MAVSDVGNRLFALSKDADNVMRAASVVLASTVNDGPVDVDHIFELSLQIAELFDRIKCEKQTKTD